MNPRYFRSTVWVFCSVRLPNFGITAYFNSKMVWVWFATRSIWLCQLMKWQAWNSAPAARNRWRPWGLAQRAWSTFGAPFSSSGLQHHLLRQEHRCLTISWYPGPGWSHWQSYLCTFYFFCFGIEGSGYGFGLSGQRALWIGKLQRTCTSGASWFGLAHGDSQSWSGRVIGLTVSDSF